MSPKAAGPAAAGPAVAGPAMPMPSGDQAAAIMQQSPEEQARTIRSMVDGLAARLEREPGDKAGWQRLAGAYRVLGEADKAKAAEEKARAIP
jgi:cytochrome c-type biogenesis protein CcmH